jgi:hypothetical protein
VQLDDLWDEKEKLMVQAAKKDKDRMEELNKLLATVSSTRELFWSRAPHISWPV